jgi:RHS repeat-associated protein
VVYAAAHDPYGGIQKVWKDDFDPKRKFSDKERDGETGLDYFGARYYANPRYRWLSIDPVTGKDAAPHNPRHFNLYAFCQNNPLNYMDPDGRAVIKVFVGLTEENTEYDFKALAEIAKEHGHTLEVYYNGQWTEDSVKKSLGESNTWTFILSHSSRGGNAEGPYVGILVPLGGSLTAPSDAIQSGNDYAAIFACNSAKYAENLIVGPSVSVFSIESDPERIYSKGYSAAAYYVLRDLILERGLPEILRVATQNMNEILR